MWLFKFKYSQFCYNACFENGNFFQWIDILGNNLNIIQISCLLRSDLVREKQMKEGDCTQLNWVAWKSMKWTHTHLRHLLLSQFHKCVMSHTHLHLLWEISIPFTWSSFYHLMITHKWTATSTSKLQVFVRTKCHPYCSSYAFYNHFTCKTVPVFLLGFYLFCVYYW